MSVSDLRPRRLGSFVFCLESPRGETIKPIKDPNCCHLNPCIFRQASLSNLWPLPVLLSSELGSHRIPSHLSTTSNPSNHYTLPTPLSTVYLGPESIVHPRKAFISWHAHNHPNENNILTKVSTSGQNPKRYQILRSVGARAALSLTKFRRTFCSVKGGGSTSCNHTSCTNARRVKRSRTHLSIPP